MYTMKADGVVFYDPSSDDAALQVLAPKASFELNKADTLEFTMPHVNVAYDSLHKLKTIITLEDDGEVIFRGRVLETTTDLYNQKQVYCEGELAYLLDSVQRPYKYDGSAKEFFFNLIQKHNAEVDEHKQFTVGLITALTDDDKVKVDSETYTDTMSEIRGILLDEFNGYLRIRHVDGVRYLDYVDKFNQLCLQPISLGVNLIDVENTLNAQDVCSVLIPLGKSKKGKITTIAKVNDNKDYIESAELIAKYGRIVKTYTFEDVDDPEEILELGQKHMERMQAVKTLTFKALDMKFAGYAVGSIRLGDSVRLAYSAYEDHITDICVKIDLDIENPEETEYTFGLPIEPLTDSNASASRKNKRDSDHMHKWLTETENSFEVNVAALDSKISLKADLILLDGYVKATNLEAEVLKVLQYADLSKADLDVGYLDASSAQISTLEANSITTSSLSIGGNSLSRTSREVVTDVIPYLNDDKLVYAVGCRTATIYYYT